MNEGYGIKFYINLSCWAIPLEFGLIKEFGIVYLHFLCFNVSYTWQTLYNT